MDGNDPRPPGLSSSNEPPYLLPDPHARAKERLVKMLIIASLTVVALGVLAGLLLMG